MNERLTYWLPALALLAVVAAFAFWWWPHAPAPPPGGEIPAAAIDARPAAPAVDAAPSSPAVKFPLDTAAAPSAQAEVDAGIAELNALLGAAAVRAYLQTDHFAQRFVATVDNLGRGFAAAQLWPVRPAPGRFTVAGAGASQTIAAGNAERYAAFVRLADGVDARAAVATYKRLYPQLQREYEALGYPGRYFNDRVVEVIDVLLATPEPQAPLEVRPTEVKGPLASRQPWPSYEFADPRWQQLASGQKLLLRIGPEHARRVKARLRELRALLVAG